MSYLEWLLGLVAATDDPVGSVIYGLAFVAVGAGLAALAGLAVRR